MARQKNSINDKYWPEVERINSYAIFMGYMSMGVRGLALLVLTWTTVVLLGGFVSMLQKTDFWFLTAITLVQTAGVFDFLLKEKASDVGSSLKGLMVAVGAAVVRPFKKHTNTSMNSSQIIEDDKVPWTARIVVGFVILVVQMLVFGIVLCPLAVLYMFGMYLSAGISLWRLIQHDYGNPDGGTKLKPALNVLYSLAVAQGVVYGCRAIYDLMARTELVEVVAKDYSLERDLVSEYLDETVAGCMKDPSFARGRNLVTYAVELLMESKSRYDYVSGVRILGAICDRGDSLRNTVDRRFLGFLEVGSWRQLDLMKELLTESASFSHVVQRLLETFGPRSPYSTEIRVRAARIVATVAGSIRLDQLPRGMMIECISSLLDTFEEYSCRPEGYEQLRDVPPRATDESDSRNPLQGYRDLVEQGFRILRKVAVNENNCRVISNTEGLVSKTMAHLITSDKLHMDHHDEWYSIAKESLEFMIMAAEESGAGTETTNLTSEISSSSQAAIMTILGCHKCHVLLKRTATQVLLPRMCQVPGASSSLARTVAGAENNAHRIDAAMILGDLCRYYTEDDENLKELKKSVANVMEEVLKEIVHWLMTTEEKQVAREANNGGNVLLAEEGLDLEQGGVPHDNDNGQESSSTPHQQKGNQHQGIQLQEALIGLCVAVSKWIDDKDQDLTSQFNEIAAKICSGQGMPHKTFKEIVHEADYKLRIDKKRA